MNTLFTVLPLLLGAPEAGAKGGSSSGQMITTIITFALVIVIFYFLIIRPQNKKKKEAQNMMNNLKKGDRVATIGGIRGIVHQVKDDTIILRVDDNTKIEFSKSAVATVLEQRPAKAEKDDEKEETEAAADKSDKEGEKS